ncbi:uncharacterized protein N7459_006390 [Penicillium hispanicum]|uniref:uncharacterized protein n=1 Tax=Penicillium hispanicum TaxID=1080232 RepID=UPI0025405C54|nr:uncharacterized protein N7459_006390 [Penicillium hispanicum]KAJ5577426.1 hypothetical protein N7459_006390 [Penicillium hispanicum]
MKSSGKLCKFFNSTIHPRRDAKHKGSPRDRNKHAEKADLKDTSRPHSQPKPDGLDSDRDPYGVMSEVAVPEPVERRPEGETDRQPSLEQSLSHARSPTSRRQEQGYDALSEVAAPEPCERDTGERSARRPSLEKQLSAAGSRGR